jgi:hypothetical protein
MIKVHRKLALFTTTVAFVAIPGLAIAGGPKKPHPTPHGPPSTTKPAPPSHPKPAPPSPKPCVAHSAGYRATGTLIAAGTSLTPQGHGRYSGTIEVNVTKVNHHGTTGDQTFTLTNARVKLHHGLSATTLADGDRVELHGKITALPKHCSTTGFTPTTTIKKVDVHQPKKAKH